MGSREEVEGGAMSWGRRFRPAVSRHPEFMTDVLQILKSVVAATAAWWLAVSVLESSMPFLAPWVALLTVYPTVYQSLKRGAQTTIATTAVFVLSDGFTEQQPMLLDRIVEVALGAAVGLLVNLLLLPPLRDRQAARCVDHINRRMGRVFVMIADELESSWTTDDQDEWSREIEAMGEDLRSARPRTLRVSGTRASANGG